MSKKLSELPLSRQFAEDGTILISSANNGTKRIDIATFLELIGGGISSQELSELTDVYINEPADGQVLKYDAHFGKWTNGAGGGGGGTSNVQNLTDLQDVAVVNPDSTCILQYNASTQKWENKTFTKIYTNIEDIPNWGVLAYSTNEAFIEFGSSKQTIMFTGAIESGGGEDPIKLDDIDLGKKGGKKISRNYIYQRLFDDELTNSQLDDLIDDLQSITEYPGRLNIYSGSLCVKINNEYVSIGPEDEWEDYSLSSYYIAMPEEIFNCQDPNNLYISVKPIKMNIGLFGGGKGASDGMVLIGWMPLSLYQMFMTMMFIEMISATATEAENLLDFTSFSGNCLQLQTIPVIVP